MSGLAPGLTLQLLIAFIELRQKLLDLCRISFRLGTSVSAALQEQRTGEQGACRRQLSYRSVKRTLLLHGLSTVKIVTGAAKSQFFFLQGERLSVAAAASATYDGSGMKPLSPSHEKVLRIRGAFASLLILIGAVVADAVMLDRNLPAGFITGAALLGAIFLIFVSPGRQYRAWGFEVTDDELHIRSGIWVRRRTVVPFGRVQHIDVGQGPVERRYDLGTLTLHTAGTRSAAVALPGLQMSDAEQMRDEIRNQIRQDLV